MARHFDPRRWLTVLVLLVVAGGCAGGDRGMLLRDTFDNPRSGWGKDQSEQFERGYEGGEYVISLRTPNWLVWAHPGKRFADVSIEVEAYLASGSADGHFGVLCRYLDADNFYYFAISPDGYYAIFSRAGGDTKILTSNDGGMIPSSAIRVGGRNRIRAVCQGEELSLYVNDALVAVVRDDALRRGDVGLAAGSGPTGDAMVKFDDLAVTTP